MVRNVMLVIFSSTLCFSTFSCAASKNNHPEEQQAPSPLSPVGENYRQRYPLTNAAQKLVNNTGDGFAALYGVRNFRAVLNGVYYRGGANNAYLKPKARPNSNPLPNVGLNHLCEEGFTQAIYLYSTNFNSAPHQIRCRTFEGNENTLEYQQISPLSYRENDQRTLLALVHEHIRNPRLGPIYDHCWNGWHASGYVASLTLRQFCDFSGSQAVDYWNKNTDGNDKSSRYDRIRDKLRSFQPYPDLRLSAEEKAALCPQPGSLSFR